VTVECDFDEDEKAFYGRLQNRADERLKQISEQGNKDYIGALVLLLRLRQACNHPHLVEMAMNKDHDAMTIGTASKGGSGSQTPRNQTTDGDMDALTALMSGVSVKAKQCDICQADLSKREMDEGAVRCGECEADLKALRKGKSLKAKNVKKEKKTAVRQRNRRVIMDDSDEGEDEGEGEWIAKGPEQHIDLGKAGGTDDEDAEGGGETLGSIDSERSESDDEDEEDSPPRARLRRKAVKNEPDEDDDEEADDDDDDSDSDSDAPVPIVRGLQRSSKGDKKPSTKIRRVLRILHAEMPEHKTIVFSQFTTMLDLIEPHLRESNLRFSRYDGSMKPDEREASLHSLRHDPKCRILLCSLKCGSLGLNLTAASRVVIIEPFWNPFVEEQAIDRVHRLNQTVDVKVYRLTVRATVEERILELQERKRELAMAAIEGGQGVGKLSMQDIISLFRHDAPDQAQQSSDEILFNKFGRDHRLLDGPDGFEQAGDLMRRVKPGKPKGYSEHEVYGRRW
jgi:SNF2 family DNA or RNA helicase